MGTEDAGVWNRGDDGKWRQFLVKDGLGDNDGYALACDHQGRIWVGHLNHGVSVWNGREWRNFGFWDGPIGERVFGIAVSPGDGDVWIATNGGLSRYIVKTNVWRYYTRANGLPSNQLSTLTFDSIGNLYLATQCEGLAIARPDDDYSQWSIVRRPKDTGDERLPTAIAGEGLPSNLINDILVSDNDVVYVATSCGLSRSSDFGVTWTYLRGADWEAKLKGLYKPLTAEPRPVKFNRQTLREDYITTLAEDSKGLLWLGYRQKGWEARRPFPDIAVYPPSGSTPPDSPYVSALLPQADGSVYVATYGHGLLQSKPSLSFIPTAQEKREMEARRGWKSIEAPDKAAPLPSYAKAVERTDLEHMVRQVAAVGSAKKDTGPAVFETPQDWTTQGNWRGRYGLYWACLCAMNSPENLLWGAGDKNIDYSMRISPKEPKNSLRYWVHWLYTDNVRSLEMPPLYLEDRIKTGLAPKSKSDVSGYQTHRQAEVDDNGEDYPMTKEGPNIYCVVRVPYGLYYLSFYNMNKDGHSGMNRMRDYRVSIRPHSPTTKLHDVSGFDEQPELARGRQRDFWGGVYNRYVVRGPQEITIEIHKNNSFNTILAGVFLNLIDDEPPPYFSSFESRRQQYGMSAMRGKQRTMSEDLPSVALKFPSNYTESMLAERLWQELVRAKQNNLGWWAGSSALYYRQLARWYEGNRNRTSSNDMPFLLKRLQECYYYLNMYSKMEEVQRRRGLTTARDVEIGLQGKGSNPITARNLDAVVKSMASGNTTAQNN